MEELPEPPPPLQPCSREINHRCLRVAMAEAYSAGRDMPPRIAEAYTVAKQTPLPEYCGALCWRLIGPLGG